MRKESILAVILTLAAATAYAEDTTRGRLPDGRAFRTDSSGIQLADYTAELELNIEEQQRRIRELESSVQEKDALLMRKGGSPAPRLIEKSLVGRTEQTTDQLEGSGIGTQAYAAAVECPDTSGYIQRISSLEDQLSTAKSQIMDLSNTSSSSRNEQAEWQKKLISAESTRSKLQLEMQNSADKLKRTEQELAKAHELLRIEKESNLTETSALREAVASGAVRASFTRPVDMRPVRGEQAAVRTQMNQLRGLVSTRNSKFQTYKTRQATSVSFAMSPVKSRSGQTLEQLTSQLERTKSLGEIAKVRAAIGEIRARVNDDIALIDRMSRQR